MIKSRKFVKTYLYLINTEIYYSNCPWTLTRIAVNFMDILVKLTTCYSVHQTMDSFFTVIKIDKLYKLNDSVHNKYAVNITNSSVKMLNSIVSIT